jgi:hypothetical protein
MLCFKVFKSHKLLNVFTIVTSRTVIEYSIPWSPSSCISSWINIISSMLASLACEYLCTKTKKANEILMKIRVLTLHPFKPDWVHGVVKLLQRMSFLAKTYILN